MGKQHDKRRQPVRSERSAGVILFRDEPAATGGRVFLLLDYGRHWDYPKGHVEKGEDDLAAALRELKEETGIDDVQMVEGFKEPIVYFFRHGKKGLVRKTVVFFLARTTKVDVQISDEHVGYVWLDEQEARKRITYPTAKKVFAVATRFLHGMNAPGSI